MSDLVVMGDSVVWGQGLAAGHKSATLLARYLGANVKMLAHAGAKIGIRDSYTVTMPSPEVPCFFPTILQQLQSFSGDHNASLAPAQVNAPAQMNDPAQVKWVLMNGGINDVEVQRVFNPMVPQYELELHTRNYCGRDMQTLLLQVTSKFPNALVMVLGYYPALSYQSAPEGVERLFSLVHGVRFAPLLDANVFRNEIVEHCLRFWKLSIGVMRGAVEQVNRTAGQMRAVFVDSGLNEMSAAYAPQSLLWEVAEGEDPQAPDEVASERIKACELAEAGLLQKQQCLLSAAGHPNIAGAARMAEQCIKAVALDRSASAGN
jgi:lysophospholipase L1-like esterase